MSEEEMKALVEMCQMLKAENTKLKEHLKRTHQIMTDMNEEIAKLKQDKQELKNKLDTANKKLDEIIEICKNKTDNFSEDIRDYLDDNLIGNEDKVKELREFRRWFIDILLIIGGE